MLKEDAVLAHHVKREREREHTLDNAYTTPSLHTYIYKEKKN